MKYMSHKEIFICIMLGLGIGFAGYLLPFLLSPIMDYSGGMPREEPLPYASIVSYLTYSFMFTGPVVFG